jgi:hypothetical protein
MSGVRWKKSDSAQNRMIVSDTLTLMCLKKGEEVKKYNVMGHEMAKMDDVKWCIRKARKDIDDLYENKSDDAKKLAHTILDDVIRMMYIDEFKAADTDEDRDAILEMTGNFIVVVSKGDGKEKDIKYFEKYDNGNAVLTDKGYRAMKFDYESKANEVAESIGSDAYAMDLNPQEQEYYEMLLDAIFNIRFDDGEEEDG